MLTAKIIFGVFALIFIILQGYYFDPWHFNRKSDDWIRKSEKDWFIKFNLARLQQLLINVLGSLMGWSAGYYLLFFRLHRSLSHIQLRGSDFIIFLIAYWGMVGQLPHVLLDKFFQALENLSKVLGLSK